MRVKIKTLQGKEKKGFKKEAETLLSNIHDIFHKKSTLQKIETNNGMALVYESKPIFLIVKNSLVPTIHAVRNFNSETPKITVDIGAVKFVMNGADIMRPGVTAVEDPVCEGSIVQIIEEKNKALIAIGRSLYDKVDLDELKAGKVVKNHHFLNDVWWKMGILSYQ